MNEWVKQVPTGDSERVLSENGIDPSKHMPAFVGDRSWRDVVRDLELKHPLDIKKRINAPGQPPDVKAALEKRLSNADNDPAVLALPTSYGTAKKHGSLQHQTATWGDILQWRKTPGYTHLSDAQKADWTSGDGPSGGSAKVRHKIPGDVIDGVGVVSEFRRIGGENEYLVRPFSSREEKSNQKKIQDAASAADVRSKRPTWSDQS